MRWARRSRVARSIPKAAISRSNRGLQRPQPLSPPDPLRSGLPPQAGLDTEPEPLEEWYNRHVVTVYKELGVFDADGLFIADGTYLFGPTTLVTRARNGCSSTSTTIPSARNRNRR